MLLSYPQFVLFGDLITEFGSGRDGFGIVAPLVDDYRTKMDIVVRGYSGYNSRFAVEILPSILQGLNNVKLMYIFFGTNDANVYDDRIGRLQASTIEEYLENIAECIDYAKERGIKVIVVGPALHDANLSYNYFKNRHLERNITGPSSSPMRNWEYSQAAKAVAEQKRVPFLNLWERFQEALGYLKEELDYDNWKDCPDLSKWLVDGVHFSSEGYRVFYEGLIEVIRSYYPDLSPENMQPKLRYYRDIDPDNVTSVFDMNLSADA